MQLVVLYVMHYWPNFFLGFNWIVAGFIHWYSLALVYVTEQKITLCEDDHRSVRKRWINKYSKLILQYQNRPFPCKTKHRKWIHAAGLPTVTAAVCTSVNHTNSLMGLYCRKLRTPRDRGFFWTFTWQLAAATVVTWVQFGTYSTSVQRRRHKENKKRR